MATAGWIMGIIGCFVLAFWIIYLVIIVLILGAASTTTY